MGRRRWQPPGDDHLIAIVRESVTIVTTGLYWHARCGGVRVLAAKQR